MLVNRLELPFTGGRIIVMQWDDCPDDAPEKESYFCKGYLQILILGTGTHPVIGFNHWNVTFASPKDGSLGISEFENGFLLVEVKDGCGFVDIEIGEGSLRGDPNGNKHPVALIDFELPDGSAVTKVVALQPDSVASEIPKGTLQ